MTLGEKIHNRREELELSQKQLGDKLGLSRQAISKWERNQSDPQTFNLVLLAEVLKMSVDELVSFDFKQSIQEEKEVAPMEKRYFCFPQLIGVTAAFLLALFMLPISFRQADAPKNQTRGWLSSFEFEMVQDEPQEKYVAFSANLLPRGATDNLKVDFTLKPMGEEGQTVSGKCDNGGYYSALFDLQDLEGKSFEISAHFRRGEEEYTKSLVTISSWEDGKSFTHTPSL